MILDSKRDSSRVTSHESCTWRVRLAVRTPASHAGSRGSIPLRATGCCLWQQLGSFQNLDGFENCFETEYSETVVSPISGSTYEYDFQEIVVYHSPVLTRLQRRME